MACVKVSQMTVNTYTTRTALSRAHTVAKAADPATFCR